jgi:alpha-L-fucosidase 2
MQKEGAADRVEEKCVWHAAPGERFEEAFPVGNGRLGAMVYGGVATERLSLNEATLWSGRPRSYRVPGAEAALAEVRQALAVDDFAKATQLCGKLMGPWTQSYLPAGNLRLFFDHDAAMEEYRRELDLDRAVCTVSYRSAGIRYTREVFASFPDQLIVMRLRASAPGHISFAAHFDSLLRGFQRRSADGDLVFHGEAPLCLDPTYLPRGRMIYEDETGTGMRFQMRLQILNRGGWARCSDSGWSIRGADEVELRLSLATSFNGHDRDPVAEGADVEARAAMPLRETAGRTFDGLLERHLADYQALYGRCRLWLGNDPDHGGTTVDRLRQKAGEPAPALAALYFNFGRYLLIACSRDTFPAANLQGLWNEHLRAPWSSNYTVNINTQMNYWPAETTHLAECHAPLFGLLKVQTETGREAAANYGCGGWCTHHNTDLWGLSCAVGEQGLGHPVYACWPMGGAWLCRHLWEHYRFSGDGRFLRETALPILKGAARFCLDWLVERTIEGTSWLVTAPATTPENQARLDDGTPVAVSVATTMDMAIIRELFTYTLNAMDVAGEADGLCAELAAALPRLFPHAIGKEGQLLEWFRDWEEPEPHHRHVSHLYPLYPSDLIQAGRDAKWVEAVRRSLERRGDDATGWSIGWKTCLWARLLDGDHAWKLIRMALRPVIVSDTNYGAGGGVYANLLDAHPPFQIDGNFGVTAGIAEMLLQSQRTERVDGRDVVVLDILPALPSAWPEGEVKGLCARGGFTVDIAWRSGRLTHLRIGSARGGECRVQVEGQVQTLALAAGGVHETNG